MEDAGTRDPPFHFLQLTTRKKFHTDVTAIFMIAVVKPQTQCTATSFHEIEEAFAMVKEGRHGGICA